MTTTTRRILSTLAAVGLLCLGTAGPAAAEHEPGSGPPSSTREGYVSDDELEPLRTGMGAVLVTALAGTAALAIRRRRHLVPSPEPRESWSRGAVPDQVSDFEPTSGARLA